MKMTLHYRAPEVCTYFRKRTKMKIIMINFEFENVCLALENKNFGVTKICERSMD